MSTTTNEAITHVYNVRIMDPDRFMKPRVFISGDIAAPTMDVMNFPGYKDEEALKAYDADMKRYNREQAAIWKQHIQAAQELGLIPEGKLRFSMKAGCTCSCSPGFIIDTKPGYSEYYITVTASIDVD